MRCQENLTNGWWRMKFIVDPPNPLVSQEKGDFILNSKNAFDCSFLSLCFFSPHPILILKLMS